MTPPHAPGYIWVTTTRLYTPLARYTLIDGDCIRTAIAVRLVWLVLRRVVDALLWGYACIALALAGMALVEKWQGSGRVKHWKQLALFEMAA